jgi:hypothetical protein
MDEFQKKAKKERKSLEEILVNAGLDPNEQINIERLAFEFPKKFSFKDPELKTRVLYLFNKNDFKIYSQSDRKKKRAVRTIYQRKCYNDLVKN